MFLTLKVCFATILRLPLSEPVAMQSSLFFLTVTLALAGAVNLRSASAPDVSDEVARETQQNIQIHDGFQAQEQKDAQTVSEVRADHELSQLQTSTVNWVVALDKDLKTRILVQSFKRTSLIAGIKDPCSGITCAANLKCPAGFTSTEVAGHCCPYCVNPNIKLEAAVTGATGTNGGKASTFCPKVWCFPTACT